MPSKVAHGYNEEVFHFLEGESKRLSPGRLQVRLQEGPYSGNSVIVVTFDDGSEEVISDMAEAKVAVQTAIGKFVGNNLQKLKDAYLQETNPYQRAADLGAYVEALEKAVGASDGDGGPTSRAAREKYELTNRQLRAKVKVLLRGVGHRFGSLANLRGYLEGTGRIQDARDELYAISTSKDVEDLVQRQAHEILSVMDDKMAKIGIMPSDPRHERMEGLALMIAALRNPAVHVLGNPVMRAMKLAFMQDDIDAAIKELEDAQQEIIEGKERVGEGAEVAGEDLEAMRGAGKYEGDDGAEKVAKGIVDEHEAADRITQLEAEMYPLRKLVVGVVEAFSDERPGLMTYKRLVRIHQSLDDYAESLHNVIHDAGLHMNDKAAGAGLRKVVLSVTGQLRDAANAANQALSSLEDVGVHSSRLATRDAGVIHNSARLLQVTGDGAKQFADDLENFLITGKSDEAAGEGRAYSETHDEEKVAKDGGEVKAPPLQTAGHPGFPAADRWLKYRVTFKGGGGSSEDVRATLKEMFGDEFNYTRWAGSNFTPGVDWATTVHSPIEPKPVEGISAKLVEGKWNADIMAARRAKGFHQIGSAPEGQMGGPLPRGTKPADYPTGLDSTKE
jgi:hypothetical protein